ncbi:MAG: hypothetical protein RSA99_01600 [Oscillospiraceae bacterium]
MKKLVSLIIATLLLSATVFSPMVSAKEKTTSGNEEEAKKVAIQYAEVRDGGAGQIGELKLTVPEMFSNDFYEKKSILLSCLCAAMV